MNKINDKKLYSPKTIKDIMDRYDFKFSKKFGQNFLIDKNIIDGICDGAEITEEDGIIEIGPGIGVLTYEMAQRAGKVISIEIDNSLIPVIEENMSGFDNFRLINEDVLNLDLNELIEKEFKGMNVKVVANLPYYITTPIIMKLLEENLNIDRIVVMVQKEVADRISSSPGNKNYGAITLAVNYYSDAKTILKVPRTVFMPSPNVDSAVLSFDIYKEPPVKAENPELMFKIIKAAFGQRRKTIINAINAANLGISKDRIKEIFEEMDIDVRRRGETFSIAEFAVISDRFNEEIKSGS